MKRVRIGGLRERITLLNRHIREEENGDFHQTWREGPSLWAQVTPVPVALKRLVAGEGWGKEKDKSPKALFLVRVRYEEELFRANRAQWRGSILYFISPPYVDSQRRWIEITACKR